MDSVALAARQLAYLLLLIGAGKIKPRHVGAGVDLARADFQEVRAAADLFPDRFFWIKRAALIDVGQHDRFADANRTTVGLFLPGDHAKQGRLPGALGA